MAKALVVDDSKTMRTILGKMLVGIGYEVCQAGNGREALEVMDREYPDVSLVLADWNMPEMNGLDLIKIVRSNPLYSSMPILMITTRGTEHDVVEALQAKVNSYIMKPFTPQELKEKIEGILKTVQVSAV